MARKKADTDSSVLKDELYPYIEKLYNPVKFKQIISRFINKRSTMLYDMCPCDRITFMGDDRDDFFKTLGIDVPHVLDILSRTYYWEDPKFRAEPAKDPFTTCMMCIIRIIYKANKGKWNSDLEIACIYLSFSGKFYPSLHSNSFPIAPIKYRHIMEYVVNNKLNMKYDLKREGSIMKAIARLDETWIDTYADELDSFTDEDVSYMILQLKDRIKSVLINIASVYFEAYKNREYIAYDIDREDDNHYHKADSNTLTIRQTSQRIISVVTTRDVDYTICRLVSDSNVKTDEIKTIIETIISNNQNLPLIEELTTLLLVEYLDFKKDGKPYDIKFITFSKSAKPNSKNPNIIRQKEILETWLSENSPAYNRRKSRLATKNSYHRAVLEYFIYLIAYNSR